MSQGIHITGVVSGEAADLISEMGAGDIVSPESPEELAGLWCELARDRARLEISPVGAHWVNKQRDEVVPRRFQQIVRQAGEPR